MMMSGGEVISEDGLSVDGVLNSDEWIQAFTFYSDMFNTLKVAPQSDIGEPRDLFAEGKLAMYLGGPWNVKQLAELDLPFEYAGSRHPYFDGGEVVTPTGGWHIGGNAKTAHPEEVGTFLHWFTGTLEGGQAWFNYGNPALSANQLTNEWMYNSEQFSEHPWSLLQLTIDEAATNPVPRPLIPGYLEYEQILQTVFSDIRNGVDVEEALQSGVERIDSELYKYQF